jgi:hypothetical protein
MTISAAVRKKLDALVDKALAEPHRYPPPALAAERALHVYSTEALFAYYLGSDGAVYELDMDSSRSADTVTDAATIRDVYAEAAKRLGLPELRP